MKREDEGAGHEGKGGRTAPLFPTLERTHLSAPRIVEEVHSIRFNQEQEMELLHRHLSKTVPMESQPSMDIHEMASQQDLITALINREKVHLPSPTDMFSPHHPTQPSPA